MFVPLYPESRKGILLFAGSLIVVVALVDWRVINDVPLGFLYLVPMLMLGRVLKPWQIVIVAAVLTVLTEEFDPFRWTIRTGMPRDTMYFAAFLAIGIFVHDASRNRRVADEHLREIERQNAARQEAEEQLKVLVDSTSAAILTADSDGCILMANEAAHRMFAAQPGTLFGSKLHRSLPALSNVSRRDAPQQSFRTVMQCRGVRDDGEPFLADICLSSYATRSGPRIAAMVLDASEELRTREETSLHQVLAGSRIAVVAVSHEVRNVCGAISVVYQNLSRGLAVNGALTGNKDFEALGKLTLALEQIATVDLQQYPERSAKVDLKSILDDLKIVITPTVHEHSIQCAWNIDPDLPPVWADPTNLMQIFLNLTNNSIRALGKMDRERILTISARSAGNGVTIEIQDNGGGVKDPEELFHPFQPRAHATGLGLYLSRAFARSFGGDVRYKPLTCSACFIVDLLVAPALERIA
jgi:PAS domain S-box-containing protein